METRGLTSRGGAFAAALCAAVALAVPGQAVANWRPAGKPVARSRGEIRGYDLKRVGGVPYVAWSASDGRNYVIRVARLDAVSGRWVRVGPVVNRDGSKDADTPSLAAGPRGTPWVAWVEVDRRGVKQIRAAHLSSDGKRWVEPDARDFSINYRPGASQPYGRDRSIWYADSPQLTFFGRVPYITFLQDNPAEYEVDVVRLTAKGRGWERVSRGVSGEDIPSTPRALVFSNQLLVGVTEDSDAVVVASRSNRAWHPLGGIANTSAPGTPEGAIGALASLHGEPYVLWRSESPSPSQVYVSRFSGGAWRLVGGGPVGSGQGSSLRVIGGRLYAALVDGGAHVSRLSDDGASWQSVAGAINSDAPTGMPVLTGVCGAPYVAFADTAAGVTSLRVARLAEAPAPIGADDGDGSDLGATPGAAR
ncbi:MAG: hypothetical protein JOZ25_12670 [Actinobacteria bacterium]|nr:hypothetical protein [Actinomycetota bacterium]